MFLMSSRRRRQNCSYQRIRFGLLNEVRAVGELPMGLALCAGDILLKHGSKPSEYRVGEAVRSHERFFLFFEHAPCPIEQGQTVGNQFFRLDH
jgi:hypothetical protein